MSTPLLMIMDFFILKYLLLLFGGLNDVYLLLIIFILGLLHFVPMLFEMKKSTFFGRILTEIDGIWRGFSFFIIFALVIIYALNCFISLPFIIIESILVLVLILCIYNYYHAHQLIIKERVIELDNLKEDINIVHLSDVHFGSIRHKRIIKQLADSLKSLSSTCDLAIISGDLADGSSMVEEDDFIELKNVGMPIIFTPGNHDFYPGIENVYAACRKAKIKILDNEWLKINSVNIFGLTFSFSDDGLSTFEWVDSIVVGDKPNILVYHVPSNWDKFSKLGFDIQLSGHTHGGQFFPATLFCKIIFGFNKGLFKLIINQKEKYLHVTTGVGSMDFPMRWGTDSEIVVLKLKAKK